MGIPVCLATDQENSRFVLGVFISGKAFLTSWSLKISSFEGQTGLSQQPGPGNDILTSLFIRLRNNHARRPQISYIACMV